MCFHVCAILYNNKNKIQQIKLETGAQQTHAHICVCACVRIAFLSLSLYRSIWQRDFFIFLFFVLHRIARVCWAQGNSGITINKTQKDYIEKTLENE